MIRPLSAFLVFVFLLTTASVSAAGYSPEIEAKLQTLRDAKSARGLPLAAGYNPGYPGRTGAFFSSFPFLFGNATIPEIELMIKDPQPVIRVMGAKVMAARCLWFNQVTSLDADHTLVDVSPWPGAKNETKTLSVAELMTELWNNPTFLTQTDFGATVELTAATPLQGSSPQSVIASPMPVFPLELARAGIDGTVTIQVTFRAGRATAVQVLRSTLKEFDATVLWAARKWRALTPTAEPDKGALHNVYEFTVQFRSGVE